MIETISTQSSRKQIAAREVVFVYYSNQDQEGAPCRLYTRAEARDAKKQNIGRFISHGKVFLLHEKTPVVAITTNRQRPAANSCCGISKREVLANVGVPVGYDISQLEVIKAQEKIKAYPHVYDKNAVLARGIWQRRVMHA